MTQLTIRGFDPELVRRLQMLAEREGLSLNQAALKLMRRGAGLEPTTGSFEIGNAIEKYSGVWSEAEAREFREATRDFDRIDPDMWR